MSYSLEINGTTEDNIESYIISGVGAPTTQTTGTLGQFYKDTSTGQIYKCVAISGTTYTWKLSAASLTYSTT